MNSVTTVDLSDFGYREIAMAADILNAWANRGLPGDFCREEVQLMFNRDSGEVFLTNSEYQVAMMNGQSLEVFYTCSECGSEGFTEDLPLCVETGCCNQCLEERASNDE